MEALGAQSLANHKLQFLTLKKEIASQFLRKDPEAATIALGMANCLLNYPPEISIGPPFDGLIHICF